MKFQILRF